MQKTNHSQGEENSRIILTGSSGTLGHHILRQLLSRPRTKILAVHRRQSDPLTAPNVEHRVIDFDNREELTAIFQDFRPSCVIHCAADGMIFPQVEWFKLIRFNVDFTLLLAEAAATQPGCHFIHLSSGLAYRSTGAPLSEMDAIDNCHPYGASKAAADVLLRSAAIEFGLPLTLFRPFSFTGVRDNSTRVFPTILRAAVEGRTVALSPGNQIRDFCSARDIARAIVLALDHTPPIEIPAVYNLGSGRSSSLRELIVGIVEELDIPVTVEFGGRPYGRFEPMHLVANIGHVTKNLGWFPRHRLAHAVGELAQDSFPELKLKSVPEHE